MIGWEMILIGPPTPLRSGRHRIAHLLQPHRLALPLLPHRIALLLQMDRPDWTCQMVEGQMPRLMISLALLRVQMQVAPPTLAARQISYQAPQQLIQKMQRQLQVQIPARKGEILP